MDQTHKILNLWGTKKNHHVEIMNICSVNLIDLDKHIMKLKWELLDVP